MDTPKTTTQLLVTFIE